MKLKWATVASTGNQPHTAAGADPRKIGARLLLRAGGQIPGWGPYELAAELAAVPTLLEASEANCCTAERRLPPRSCVCSAQRCLCS